MGYGLKSDGHRKYGYAQRGRPATLESALGLHAKGRYSLLGACSLSGFLLGASEVFNTEDDAITAEIFNRWVIERLVRWHRFESML
jgi:hypothetical protein